MKRLILFVMAALLLAAAMGAVSYYQGGALAVSSQQAVAQVQYRTTGTVWFVATDGSATNDGLSPGSAKLSPKTVIEAASANDMVMLGPGTFALGANAITVPTGVTVKGAGIDVTILTSTRSSTGTGGAIYIPGDNTLTEDLTVEGIGTIQMAVGTFNDGTRTDASFEEAVLRRVKGSVDYDAFYVNHDSDRVSATLIDCLWFSDYDGMSFRKAEADSEFVLIDNQINHRGASGSEPSRGIWCEETDVSIWAYNVDIYGTSASEASYGVWCDAGLVVLHGGTIYGYSSHANPFPISLYQYATGKVVAAGVNYDRTQAYGTIADVGIAGSADQYTYELVGDVVLADATTPPLILGWTTPATTEVDLSGSGNDATYSNFAVTDQLTKGIARALSFYAGTDEYLTVSDDAAFSWDDSGDVPWSICAWVEVVATATDQVIISKWDEHVDGDPEDREWKLWIDSAEKLNLRLEDESVPSYEGRITDAALTAGWRFVVVTYDSAGGGAASAGITIYVDGVLVASTAADNGAYTAMEAGGSDVLIGGKTGTGDAVDAFFQGDMGVLWIEDLDISAAQVWEYYLKTRAYYGE